MLFGKSHEGHPQDGAKKTIAELEAFMQEAMRNAGRSRTSYENETRPGVKKALFEIYEHNNAIAVHAVTAYTAAKKKEMF